MDMLRSLEQSTSLILILGLALGALSCWLLQLYRTRKEIPRRNYWTPSRDQKRAENREQRADEESEDLHVHRTFLNVFAIMSGERRQALIKYYQEKFDCDALAAMQRAVDDFRNEAKRYG